MLSESKWFENDPKCEWCDTSGIKIHPHHGKPTYFLVSIKDTTQTGSSKFSRIVLCGECLHDWIQNGETIVFAFKITEASE